eukprot:scaffold3915_cov19-Tisochrysis_lutea.AAC.3
MDAITCTRTEKKANKCTRITIRAHTAALVNVGRSVAILLLVQHKQGHANAPRPVLPAGSGRTTAVAPEGACPG